MNPTARTLEDLSFPQLRDALARRCRTAAGRVRAAGRPLLETREAVEESLQRVAEAQRLREQPYRLPLDSVADVAGAVARAAKGALLEPRELIDVAQTLFALVRAREGLLLRENVAPGLAVWARSLPLLEPLASRLDQSFDASGEIADRASPALQEARNHARGLHRTIKAQLEKLLREPAFVLNLRESYFSIRNERYVIPLLASSRKDVPGIVHNASQSGQTLFVEPQALVGLGNDLAIAQSLVAEEERRVLQSLSEAVGREADRIEAGLDAGARLDEVEAAALLSENLEAHAPDIQEPTGEAFLRALRHPLLVLHGNDVVANDVSLSGGVRALVISGPNAGGKTVTLTAVGLAALMLRAGLPVPAAKGSRLPFYRSVHSVVGDAQSLDEGLSTFSAHVAALNEIHRSASEGALVLIDEIAADTDPQEGAALAASLLEDFLDRGASAVVTTHLEELKALAHVDGRFNNARVGFDPRRMAPTFRLQLGAAGASSAIALAEHMGLDPRICERARLRLTGTGGALAQALRSIEEERAKLAQEQDALEQARRATEAEREEARRAREEERRARTEEAHARQEQLRVELERALIEVRERVAALRNESSLSEAEALQTALRARVQKVEQDRLSTEAEVAPPAPADLKAGSWVRHLGLGRDVEVLEVSEEEITVAAGPMKLRVSRGELAAARSSKPRSTFRDAATVGRESQTRAEALAPGDVQSGPSRCDVRGMRVDEAMHHVQAFLDPLLRAGVPTAIVLHGHGTGALKSALREQLAGSPYVEALRPGAAHEGGDAVTVITLRG